MISEKLHKVCTMPHLTASDLSDRNIKNYSSVLTVFFCHWRIYST